MLEHAFTTEIRKILKEKFNDKSTKTRAANRGSKSRGSFANHYAIYVLVEDYIKNGFNNKNGY